MKIKTSELIGPALDWAVAVCEGITPFAVKKRHSEGWILYEFRAATRPLEYSTSWAQGGPMIDRELISFGAEGDSAKPVWVAALSYSKEVRYVEGIARRFCSMRGPTTLVAAMRCYVASKLGDEVDVPEELLK